jgi:hypothetical protein
VIDILTANTDLPSCGCTVTGNGTAQAPIRIVFCHTHQMSGFTCEHDRRTMERLNRANTRVDRVKTTQVICVIAKVGDGTEESPVRSLEMYHTLDGEFIGEIGGSS